MSKAYTTEQYAAEFASCERRPFSELSNMVRALSFHAWNNSPEEAARLDAAKAVLKGRTRAARKR